MSKTDLNELDNAVEKMPALWPHTLRVYEELKRRAEPDEDNRYVYTGYVTRLFKDELHLPQPYYTRIFRMLEAMGVVAQKKRGGGAAPSEWYVDVEQVLSPQLFLAQYNEHGSNEVREKDTKGEALEQRIRDLTEMLQKHEQRIATLEDIIFNSPILNGDNSA